MGSSTCGLIIEVEIGFVCLVSNICTRTVSTSSAEKVGDLHREEERAASFTRAWVGVEGVAKGHVEVDYGDANSSAEAEARAVSIRPEASQVEDRDRTNGEQVDLVLDGFE